MLAQFASAKIQVENPKTEPPATVIVVAHGEVNLDRKRVYHQPVFPELEAGIVSCKPFVEWQLLGDPYSSAKELAVHCTAVKSKP